MAVKPIATTKRRWLALLFLTLPLAQVNWGCLVLQSILQGWCYALYWMVCLALALAAVGLAAVELAASWRAYRQERLRCRRDYEKLPA